jgi:hypothetical protein
MTLHSHTLIALTALSLATSGCSSTEGHLADLDRPGITCLAWLGCPDPAFVPACSANLPAPISLEQLFALQHAEGTQVVVRARVNKDVDGPTFAFSSDLACQPDSCCKHYHPPLVMFDDGAPTRRLNLSGRGLDCVADESHTCCAVDAVGQIAVARGTVKSRREDHDSLLPFPNGRDPHERRFEFMELADAELCIAR